MKEHGTAFGPLPRAAVPLGTPTGGAPLGALGAGLRAAFAGGSFGTYLGIGLASTFESAFGSGTSAGRGINFTGGALSSREITGTVPTPVPGTAAVVAGTDPEEEPGTVPLPDPGTVAGTGPAAGTGPTEPGTMPLPDPGTAVAGTETAGTETAGTGPIEPGATPLPDPGTAAAGTETAGTGPSEPRTEPPEDPGASVAAVPPEGPDTVTTTGAGPVVPPPITGVAVVAVATVPGGGVSGAVPAAAPIG